MKKVLILTALLAMVATSSFATIAGSKHDLSAAGTGNVTNTGTNTETCVYCHTPHGAAAAGPLWNQSTGSVGAVYTSAISSTYDGVASAVASDAGLCLACHDGTTVAMPTNPPNTGTVIISGTLNAQANIGAGSGDLSNDHPIAFAYPADAAATADELQTKAVVEASSAAMAGALSYGAGSDMWCSSCHDVHGGAATTPFLRVANTNSDLCLVCHIK